MEYARNEINAIGGYYACGKELTQRRKRSMILTRTKPSVYTQGIGLWPEIEVIMTLLRDEYDIQIELAISATYSPVFASETGFATSSGSWGTGVILSGYMNGMEAI